MAVAKRIDGHAHPLEHFDIEIANRSVAGIADVTARGIMRLLNENWDGYGAAVLPAHVIELARELVRLVVVLLSKRTPSPGPIHVTPTPTAGVLIEWAVGVMQHEVEIDPAQGFRVLRRRCCRKP
jgi:hypothetical protein